MHANQRNKRTILFNKESQLNINTTRSTPVLFTNNQLDVNCHGTIFCSFKRERWIFFKKNSNK